MKLIDNAGFKPWAIFFWKEAINKGTYESRDEKQQADNIME